MKRLYETTFTVPAGTLAAAPVVQNVPLEDAQLEAVRIVVPDGHNGLTGLAILWGGIQVVPFGQGTAIVANNEVIDYPWDGEITAAGLSVAGFNTDVYAHSFYLRWTITDLPSGPDVSISSPQAGTTGAVVSGDVADLAGITDVTAEPGPAPELVAAGAAPRTPPGLTGSQTTARRAEPIR